MWSGFNLRGDLAKLSDAELAERFDTALREREHFGHHRSAHDVAHTIEAYVLTRMLGRGPFRARPLYRLYRHFYDFGLDRQSVGDLYLLDCEIKDIRDEMIRRLKGRKTGARPLR